MTIFFMDGMDVYSATADIIERWDANDGSGITYSSTIGRFGGGGVVIFVDDRYITKVFDAIPEIVLSFSLFRAFAASQNDDVIQIDNGTVDAGISLVSQTGSSSIAVYRGSRLTGTNLGTFDFTTNAWHWLSIRYLADDVNGTIDIEVDGVNLFSFVGDTVNSGLPEIQRVLLGGDNAQNYTYDDVIMTDVSGPAPFNTLLTDRHIDTILPDAAGDDTDWLPTGGANFANAQTNNNDTSYNESETPGDKDLYNMANMGFSPTVIDAVNVTAVVKNPDGGVTQFKVKVKSGATEGDGPDTQPVSMYKYFDKVFLTNPATASAWTESEVNSAQAGVEII